MTLQQPLVTQYWFWLLRGHPVTSFCTPFFLDHAVGAESCHGNVRASVPGG